MYLKKIYLENVGPIEKLVSKAGNGEIEGLELPFYEAGENAGNPKPLILVGQNGSGKSTILSFIVNALFLMKRAAYNKQDEIEKDQVFRLRSNIQIRSEATSYWADIEFKNGSFVKEFRSTFPEEDIKKRGNDDLLKQRYIAAGESGINYNFESEKHQKDYKKGVFLYFPPNRFEEPIWLNSNSLNLSAKFEDLNKFEGETKRKIIRQSPLKEVKSWLMDLLLDEFTYESERAPVEFLDGTTKLGIFPKTDGIGVNIRNSLNKFLRIFLGKEGVRTGFGDRKSRLVGVYKDEAISGSISTIKQIIPDLFAMSSGEVSLLCMFCAILRDADLADLFDEKPDNSQWKNLGDIEGIVVIDEIDLHLHTKMQSEILPKLIALFPKIQFIITTHSPLFLLGMEEQFTKDGIEIIELKNGKSEKLIAGEDYSEFKDVAALLKLKEKAQKIDKNTIITEGKWDREYIKRAACLLNREALLSEFDLSEEFEGFGDLNNLWKQKDNALKLVKEKIILLYDCDTDLSQGREVNQENRKEGQYPKENPKIFKRVIPLQENHLLKIGIENLFDNETIKRMAEKGFVSLIEHGSKKVDGVEQEPNKKCYEIKGSSKSEKDQNKKNMCKHLCSEENIHAADDFKNFDQIFKMIEEVLNSTNTTN
ncbi:MAG: hypothetical protein FJ368_01545 [Pelagibacterales bacterium]|nr:hypothetical protein [Pelagibacterales bacterium]